MPTFRRGLGAVETDGQSRGTNFKPFAPQIFWKDDREEKFVLLFTPVSETYQVSIHEWIPIKVQRGGETVTRYEQFVSRKDPSIGEATDDLEDRLDMIPRLRNIGIGVELEPVMETIKGRQRPKGFAIKTDTYTRHRDGNPEEVEQPLIGIISQSPHNFWGWPNSYHETQAPITETPLQVVRRGKDKNTGYDFIPFQDVEVDYTSLFANVQNISYLADDIDAIVGEAEGQDNDLDSALVIANALLEKRMDELSDKARYEELVSPIQHIESRFGKKTDTKEDTPPSTNGTSQQPSESKVRKFQNLRKQVEGRN
jgi:hypothetical protein